MKYAVESKFYDDGRVTSKIKKVDDNTVEREDRLSEYDYYLEIFDTPEEAEYWHSQNLKCNFIRKGKE